MKSATSIIAASVLVALLSLGDATSPLDANAGLYHATARQAGAPTCEVVRLPWNLCTHCKLKNFTGSGPNLNFGGVNRFDIYDLSNKQCRYSIKKYLDENPCDQKRATAFKNMDDPKKPGAYKTMIYFMYSVCETCCDCIPIGATLESYEERKNSTSEEFQLLNIKRGNCPAHVFYDTCKIWPNARKYMNLKGKQTKVQKWCDDFKKWQFSPAAKGWLKNNNATGYTWRMRMAMNQLMKAARCAEETQWKNCFRMEKAQGRV